MKRLKDVMPVKALTELIIMLILYVLFDQGGVIKYPVSLALCALYLWLGRKKKWSLDIMACVAIPSAVYLLLGSLSSMICAGAQMTTVKVLMYILVPLILAFSMYAYHGKEMHHNIFAQFIGCVLAYAIFDAPTFIKIFRWESVFAFSFGIFTLYFFYKKQWKLFIMAILFMLFAEKRIAILAVFAGLCVMGMLQFFRYSKKLATIVWSGAMVAVFGYLYLIYSGIMDAFCWGANINTNGRVEMYSRMANEFEFSALFLGKGLGTVEYLLNFWNDERFANLHKDLLKFYIELGFLGLLIYLGSYFVMFRLAGKIASGSKVACLVAVSVYSLFLFATDNVSIYSLYLLPLYSVLFAVLSSDSPEKQS